MRYWLVDASGWQRWFGRTVSELRETADSLFRHTDKTGWRVVDRHNGDVAVYTYQGKAQ